MDQSIGSRILGKLAVAITIIALLDLAYVNWWIVKSQKSEVNVQSDEERREVETKVIEPSPIASPSSSPANEPKVETKTVETKTVVERETQTIVQTAQKEIFVPMGSGSTTSSTFVDLSGTDVTIDTNKYSSIESIVFEASIWVEGGNGRATAQLYNVDDKTPYIESQMSSTSGSGSVKTSGKVPIPSGRKTYRVQAKTDLTNFPAHADNARMKITLK